MISVVIPSYNRKDSIFDLLRDVLNQDCDDFEVIVVDDNSPDGSADAIEAEFPQIRLLRSERNGGPCVARNRGILAAKGDIIVGFDSDVTVPDPNVLTKVAAAFKERPEATALSFRLFKPDGVTEDHERWWHPRPIEKYATKWFETDYFCGTGCAFRRDALIAAGMYPEILYMHYEEVELAFRLMNGGGKIFYTPDIAVLHHASPIANRGKIYKYYKPRNQILLAFAVFPWPRVVTYLTPRITVNFFNAIRDRSLSDYFQALRSAMNLAGTRLASREPLTADTMRRISALRRQAAD